MAYCKKHLPERNMKIVDSRVAGFDRKSPDERAVELDKIAKQKGTPDLDMGSQEVLAYIALKSVHQESRMLALDKISDPELLLFIAHYCAPKKNETRLITDEYEEIEEHIDAKKAAIRILGAMNRMDMLDTNHFRHSGNVLHTAALDELSRSSDATYSNQTLLEIAALSTNQPGRLAAVKKIKCIETLAFLAENSNHVDSAIYALFLIKGARNAGEFEFKGIAIQTKHEAVGMLALAEIVTPESLVEIARDSKLERVRMAAVERLSEFKDALKRLTIIGDNNVMNLAYDLLEECHRPSSLLPK